MKTTKTVVAAFVALSAPAFADFQGLVDRHEDVNVSLLETVGNAVDSVGDALTVSDSLPPMLSKGTREFGVAGAVNFADDIAYNLNFSYGWFIKDQWEVGGRLGVQGVDSDVNFNLSLFTEYNFVIKETCKWVPYIGFSAGWESLSSDVLDSDSISLGLDFGLKYFLRENMAVSFSIGAKYAFDDVFPGEDDFAQQINIGTRYYF